MSDVNQAFLRAYVKSRSRGESVDIPGIPSAKQALPVPQDDVQRRVDAPPSQTAPTRAAEAPTEVSPQIKTAPVKTGVWSALGVERGMKGSVVSDGPPAVVRNATTAVPPETTQVRAKSPSLESLNQAWTKKRAPALEGLKPKAPAAPPQPPEPVDEKVRIRLDSPISNRAPGPHPIPATDRGVEKEPVQKLPLPAAFAPAWEVDSFSWPEVVTRLEQSDPGTFRRVGHHLVNANQTGLKVLAVTSGERGVGRSTVAMHMARSAAAAGLKVALVDADAANPSLVDQLRLDVQNGWQDCLFEAVPLEESAVHAVSDKITLFPLTDVVSPQQVRANLLRMSKLIRRISNAFDLVILDSCRLHLDQRELIGLSNERAVDAAIVVFDTELSIKEKIDSAISILQSLGMHSIGLVENFRS
ncbi:MAG: tyrosine-protein kinase family protein [Planctomycetota bacterium]